VRNNADTARKGGKAAKKRGVSFIEKRSNLPRDYRSTGGLRNCQLIPQREEHHAIAGTAAKSNRLAHL